jgi:hypothetical protein
MKEHFYGYKNILIHILVIKHGNIFPVHGTGDSS